MTLNEFKSSLSASRPPEGLPHLLNAMWYEHKNDWEMAHNIAQETGTEEGSLVHAYLHRKEGDQGNAAYWYRRAGRPVPRVSMDEEWEQIVSELLETPA
jgi:hypothetical protein